MATSSNKFSSQVGQVYSRPNLKLGHYSILLSKSALRDFQLMPTDALTPENLRGGELSPRRFDPKIVMRYDHGRENMEQNAVNFLGYDEG